MNEMPPARKDMSLARLVGHAMYRALLYPTVQRVLAIDNVVHARVVDSDRWCLAASTEWTCLQSVHAWS